MTGTSTPGPFPRRVGGLLLEALLALALLVGIGVFVLATTRQAVVATERADRRAAAVELAASRIAEIEAGLVSLDAVGDLFEVPDEVGFEEVDRPRWRFAVAVETAPSPVEGLVRIEVVVRSDEEDADETVLARLVTLVEQEGASR